MTKVTDKIEGIYYFRVKNSRNKKIIFLLLILIFFTLSIMFIYNYYDFFIKTDAFHINIDNNSLQNTKDNIDNTIQIEENNIENLDEIIFYYEDSTQN